MRSRERRFMSFRMLVFLLPFLVVIAFWRGNAWGVPPAIVAEIDRLVLKSHLGPAASMCRDEDFLRRIYLDLWGIIPSPEEAREFLSNQASNKRSQLIERLVRAPQFARHMAYVFDSWLLERRLDKGIDHDEWRDYLTESFLERKPYDQLIREILVADGANPGTRARAKFLLDRDCDPSGLVRDVGRIILGKDLQCAQCHNHPLVDDYLQEDYQGLLAILERTFLFTDLKNNSTLYVGERGDGMVEFHSVFVKDDPQHLALPCVPGSGPISPPLPDPGTEFVVSPAENVRPIPRTSLRSDLASRATMNNVDFDRAIANRLWKFMFGKGLVEPVDMHHSDNPPSHPELLSYLAQRIHEQGYQIADFIEVLANTRAYQRALDAPSLTEAQSFRDQAAICLVRDAELGAELDAQFLQEGDAFKTAQSQFQDAGLKCQTLMRAFLADRTALVAKNGEVDKSRAETEPLAKQLADDQGKRQLVADAAEKATAAAQALPADASIQTAAQSLNARLAEMNQGVAELEPKVAERQAALQKLVAEQSQLHEKMVVSRDSARTEFPHYTEATRQWEESLQRRHALKENRAAIKRRMELAQQLIEQVVSPEVTGQDATLAGALTPPVPSSESTALSVEVSAGTTSVPAGEPLPDAILQAWTDRFVIASPRHLSPEQLAWSASQATGQLQLEDRAVLQEWEKNHPSPENLDPTSQAERNIQRDKEVRRALRTRLSGSINQFAQLFGGMAGQSQTEFHAAADQALFLSNSGQIQGMIVPQGGNLSERLVGQADAQRFMNELFLSVLSRTPSDSERAIVEEYLAKRVDARAAAVQELVWGLLTSAEFRFYR